MPDSQILPSVREMWAQIAASPVVFPDDGISIVTSPRSRMCPPGWVGLVLLAGAGIGTAPDDATADAVRTALADCPPERLRDPSEAAKVLPAGEMLGPVTLAYLASDSFRPSSGPAVEQLPADHPDLKALENQCSPEERHEASIGELTSPVFAIREGRDIIAAAGYVAWLRATAHMAILTAPRARGQGLAKVTASSAVAHAVAARMLPQWRARVPASQQVARALGFAELGVQIRLKIA
ncbi:GNAT superfamily N-acetyltransferase [Catenulispora sp. MAP12-49]|uniref:GNAT family N-acetyltransferase n=1 Tax=Catenulispora sp. MAP12-49 TaxID=3156302 RepID=UPI003513F270